MVLIFDGNYLFYKSLFVFSSYGSNGRLLDSDQDQAMFVRKVATDMSYAIRQFGNPDHVIFTIDSRSWRKDIDIHDGAYKGHREKDESKVNWNAFYDIMNDFGRILLSRGFVVSRQEKAEGDDLMALWSMALLENGMDAIVITGDKDLTQTVAVNDSGNFSVVYNSNTKTRKLVTSKGFKKWMTSDEVDIFNADSYMNRGKDLIQDALNSIDIEEIDPFYVVFEKVIMGDAGDAVPPIFTWQKDNKTFRVTPAKCLRIWEIINAVKPLTDIMDLPSRATEIANAINAVVKQNPAADLIRHNLSRNIQLVFLDKRVIPESIQVEFAPHVEALLKRKTLSARNYDMHGLLEGTKYITNGKTFEADIFAALSKPRK
jgi:5'-3' exonuclease